MVHSVFDSIRRNLDHYVVRRWRSIRLFWHRGRHGWSIEDTYSFDYNHALYVDNVLTKLIEVGDGFYPSVLMKDPLGPHDEEDDQRCREEWNAILTDIRDGFRAYHTTIVDYSLAKPEQRKEAEEQFEHAWELFHKYYKGLWW